MQDGRLLLLRRNTEPWLGWWDIPGGFCDAEEHPMVCAAREAREETGIAADVTGYLGMWLDRYPGPDDPDHIVTLNVYYHAVAGAEVDVWHSSPAGLYEQQDAGQAEMNLRGKLVTDEHGRFWFRTVKMAGYPIPTGTVVAVSPT